MRRYAAQKAGFLTLFGAFRCSFDMLLQRGLRYRVAAARGSGQDSSGGQRRRAACAQDQAGRSGATATDPSGGRIARAERRAACAQDQAGEQGATASRPKRGAHSPRPRQPQGKRSEPKLETPRPREPRRRTGRRRRANPKQPQQQPPPPRTSGGTTSAGGGGRRPGTAATRQPPPRQTQQEQRRRERGEGVYLFAPPKRFWGSERAAQAAVRFIYQARSRASLRVSGGAESP